MTAYACRTAPTARAPAPGSECLPASRTRSAPLRRRQRGLSRPVLLALVAALVAAGGAGVWLWQRGAAGTPGAGQMTGQTAGQASGPAGAASAPAGGASGPAAGGPGRRFGGMNRVQPVSVGQVRQQDMRVIVNAIGNISALNTATVRTRVEGELKAIRFREGQQVRAGQLLAEIDPRAYEVALAQAQAQLARDTAQLRNAQLDLERYKDLLAKDSIARQQVDTQDALVRQLQATVQGAQANVDNARLQLSYTKVTAPISGRLGLKLADLGNTVRPSDANGIVSITQTQPISLVFAVPEMHLRAVARNLRANQPMQVEAWDREQRNLLATGRVTTLDNAIDAATGTVKLKAEFANTDGLLFPNQFVNIRLQLDTQSAALVVPANAIQRGAQGIFVYVVKDDNTVTVRRVRPGAADGGWISVQGELSAGERVVTDGADRLREGARVDVVTPPARPGGMGMGMGAGPGAGSAAGPGTASGSGSGLGAGSGAGPGGPGAAPGGAMATPGASPTAPTGAIGPAPKAATGAAAGAPGPAAPLPVEPPTTAAPAAGAAADAPAGTAPASPAARPAGATGAGAGAGAGPGAAAGARPGAGAQAGGGMPDWTVPGTRPPWLDRLPPDMQERFMKMNQEERRVFIERLRERRRQMQQGEGN